MKHCLKGLAGDLLGGGINVICALLCTIIIASIEFWRLALVVLAIIPGVTRGWYFKMRESARTIHLRTSSRHCLSLCLGSRPWPSLCCSNCLPHRRGHDLRRFALSRSQSPSSSFRRPAELGSCYRIHSTAHGAPEICMKNNNEPTNL